MTKSPPSADFWQSFSLVESDGPVYLRLATAIQSLIERGDLVSDDPLPSSRRLGEILEVNRHTVSAAFDDLVEKGWLTSELRRGYKVASTLPKFGKPSKKFRMTFVNQIRMAEFNPTHPISYNFQSGLPDLREFPLEEYRTHLNDAVRFGDRQSLGYSPPAGHEPLREQIARHLENTRGVSNRSILVTIGSQEGIYIASRLMLSPGDTVAMEEQCYPPARETFRICGAKTIALKMDDEGVIPEAFESQIRKHNPKLVFLTPTHQFPTTVNMSASRRMEIYQLALNYGVPIFEDDYDHEFHYTSTPPKPLASFDKSDLVLYSSTFSKLLFPGARLAFMAVPKKFADEFCQYRRIVTHQNEILSQDALARWLESGGVYRHLRKMRKLYMHRLEVIESALRDLNSSELTWNSPTGGMAVWLNTARDADKVAKAAAESGVFVTPESHYRLRSGSNTHLRLGFSNQNDEEIKSGIKALGKILK